MPDDDMVKRFEDEINRELTDLLNEEEAINARRRLFMQSESVREHMEQHKNSEAMLIFGSGSVQEKKGREGIEALASDEEWRDWVSKQQKKDEGTKFLGYEANKQQAHGQGFAGYGSNTGSEKGFGGYASAAQEQPASASYHQGGDMAWCSDCGCGFERTNSGDVMQSSAVPGQEASGSSGSYAGAGGGRKSSSASGQGYTAASSSKLSYSLGSSASGKVKYGH